MDVFTSHVRFMRPMELLSKAERIAMHVLKLLSKRHFYHSGLDKRILASQCMCVYLCYINPML